MISPEGVILALMFWVLLACGLAWLCCSCANGYKAIRRFQDEQYARDHFRQTERFRRDILA